MKEVGVGAIRNEAESVGEQRDSHRAARPGDRPGDRPETAAGGSRASEGVWNIDEVAAYLQIPVSSIYKMTARKAAVRIPHIHIGRTLRFRRSDIDRWLTLLTISNLNALTKMRQKVSRGGHGDDSQTPSP